MKSTIVEKSNPVKSEYPCLKVWRDATETFIVEFSKKDTGHVVYTDGKTWKRGEHEDDWDEKEFTHFTGQIILEND